MRQHEPAFNSQQEPALHRQRLRSRAGAHADILKTTEEIEAFVKQHPVVVLSHFEKENEARTHAC